MYEMITKDLQKADSFDLNFNQISNYDYGIQGLTFKALR